MSSLVPNDTPTYAVPEANLVAPNDYLARQFNIPASRMFLINKSLKVFHEKYPASPMYDASQGDGGASLPGVPISILQRAAELQLEHGTAYDMPYGTDAFRKVVLEKYWKLDPKVGLGLGNVKHTRPCWRWDMGALEMWSLSRVCHGYHTIGVLTASGQTFYMLRVIHRMVGHIPKMA
jgi:hypothetical protein